MTRRYLFVFYSDLLHLDIEQLEKVADRIYLIVAENVITIPLTTVLRLKKLKKSLKWVVAESDAPDARLVQLSFMLGKLHEKVSTDIEFAIVTDDQEYDALINFVNRSHRKCLRVHLGHDAYLDDYDEEAVVAEAAQQASSLSPRVVVHRHPHAHNNSVSITTEERSSAADAAAYVQYG